MGATRQNDLKRIDDTASCAISIHSSFWTIRDFLSLENGSKINPSFPKSPDSALPN